MFLNQFLLTVPHPRPPSHKWYHPNIESDIINEEQYLLCLLLSKWGWAPLIPLSLYSGRAPHSLCNCVPRTLALSPHCLCAEHTWGWVGRGGREAQSEASAGNTSTISYVDAHHVHWEDCMAELSRAAALLSGYRQAACCLHRNPLLHMQVISISWTVVPLIFFFFLEYLYSFLNL